MFSHVRLSVEHVLRRLVPTAYRPLVRGAALTTRYVADGGARVSFRSELDGQWTVVHVER